MGAVVWPYWRLRYPGVGFWNLFSTPVLWIRSTIGLAAGARNYIGLPFVIASAMAHAVRVNDSNPDGVDPDYIVQSSIQSFGASSSFGLLSRVHESGVRGSIQENDYASNLNATMPEMPHATWSLDRKIRNKGMHALNGNGSWEPESGPTSVQQCLLPKFRNSIDRPYWKDLPTLLSNH